MSNDTGANGKGNLLWLVYISLFIAGGMLLADALGVRALNRLTVRLGAALLFSAIALMAGKDKPAGIVAIAIVWIAVLITLFN